MKYDLPIKGMTCASCVARVEKIIGKMDNVKNVSVNLATERVSFESDKDAIDLKVISSAIKEYGYELVIDGTESQLNLSSINKVSDEDDEYYKNLKSEFLFALVFTIPIFLISMLMDYKDRKSVV